MSRPTEAYFKEGDRVFVTRIVDIGDRPAILPGELCAVIKVSATLQGVSYGVRPLSWNDDAPGPAWVWAAELRAAPEGL